MRTPVKLWSLVAVGLAILAASLQAEFLYMVTDIAAYRVAENGGLTAVTQLTVTPGKVPRSLAVDLLHRNLRFQ